jgi:hypothetical protein
MTTTDHTNMLLIQLTAQLILANRIALANSLHPLMSSIPEVANTVSIKELQTLAKKHDELSAQFVEVSAGIIARMHPNE